MEIKINKNIFQIGDVYVMTEKAVGSDWKKSTILTLRHSAGCKKYTTIKEKKRKTSENKKTNKKPKKKSKKNEEESEEDD